MTDYYTELNIDRNLGVDEINKELSKLENTWKRRELNSPEKATKILALIVYAREVFKSAQTKSKYDKELEESKKPSESVDPDQQRMADIEKWKNDADTYCDQGEYDLAKIAIDKALTLAGGSRDDDLCNEAAVIYMEVGEYAAALNFINNAIVANPQNGLHYFVKSGVCARYAASLRWNDRLKADKFYNEERKALQTGLDVANAAGDTFAKGRLLGALAFSLYFDPNPDRVKAEELAREALALGENIGNAQKVIDAAAAQHRADEQAAKNKKEAEEKAAIEQQKRAEEEEKRRRQLEQEKEAKRKAAEERERKLVSRSKTLAKLSEVTAAVIVIFEMKSLWFSGEDYMVYMSIAVLAMIVYSLILAIEVYFASDKVAGIFGLLGIADVIIYTILFIVCRSDFGGLIVFPLIGFGSYFIFSGIVGYFKK